MNSLHQLINHKIFGKAV